MIEKRMNRRFLPLMPGMESLKCGSPMEISRFPLLSVPLAGSGPAAGLLLCVAKEVAKNHRALQQFRRSGQRSVTRHLGIRMTRIDNTAILL